MIFVKHSVLVFRILKWVLLVSFAVFVIASTFGMIHERGKAVLVAQASTQASVEQNLGAISVALWMYDKATMDALLTGFVQSRSVVLAEFLTSKGTLAEVRKPGFTGSVDKVLEVPIMSPDKTRLLGSLRISESYAEVNAQVVDTLITLVVTDLIKVVSLALVLFAIVYREIAKPLHQLAVEVSRLGHAESEPQIVLARKKTNSSNRDELDMLVAAINGFVAERGDEMRRRSEAEGNRLAAERALAESEENLAITLHSIGDAVIATDADGLITRMNLMAERLTGWTFADAVGHPLSEVFHIINAETREAVADPVQVVIAYAQVVGLAYHTVLLSRDGSEYRISDSAAPIRNAAGEIVGVVLVFSDITERYRAEEDLRQTRFSVDAASDALFWMTPDARVVDVNEAACRALGYSREDLLQMHLSDFDAQYDAERWSQQFDELRQCGSMTFESSHRARDGSVFPVEVVANYVKYGNEERNCSFIRDITARKQAEAALQEKEERWKFALEGSAEGVWDWNIQTGEVVFSRRWKEMAGYSDAEIANDLFEWTSRVHPDDWQKLSTALHEHVNGKTPAVEFEFRMLCKDGSWLWMLGRGMVVSRDAEGNALRMVGTNADISERKASADKIERLAFYDPLTSLPNRRLMLDRLEQALSSSARQNRQGALMLLDMDNFKTLNDTLGHDVGDQFLVEVAHRLQASVRECDTVARLGGDEFVVILEGLSQDEASLDKENLAAMQAENVARKILNAMSQTYQLDLSAGDDLKSARSYHCTSSIGITLFEGNAISADELMKRADTAMYQAKSAGRNAFRFFDPTMQAEVTARAALDNDLREALREGQFCLHYQPQVDQSGRWIGAEALVRWRHPLRGIIYPVEFIQQTELTGLILPLGDWVLESACTQLLAWASMPELSHLTVAVNVSARQFRQPEFVSKVLTIVERTGVDPKMLKLELTESLLLEDVEEVVAKMSALKAKGISFSLDDFGTGYSSLSYLKRLPLDQLKIDQSFVRDVLTDPNDATIARTIVALAKSMGMNVIAEGVETEAQRRFLAANGCMAYQGYLFGRPMPVDDFTQRAALSSNSVP